MFFGKVFNPVSCFLLLLSGGVPAQPQPVEIRLIAQVKADGEMLRLGDVAELVSAERESASDLGAISLGYAPGIGAVRILERERLLLAIRAAGFAAEAFRFTGAARVLVRRASQQLTVDQVREAVEQTALAEFRASGIPARLSRLEMPSHIEIPSGVVELQASLGSARNLFMPFTVFVDVRQAGRIVHRFNVTAQVEAHATVLVAARDLAAGRRAGREEFIEQVQRLEQPLSAYVQDVSLLRGHSLRRGLQRGEPLMREWFMADILVHSGQAVRILARQKDAPPGTAAGVQIIVTGEARSAGRIGDRIPVRNTVSGAMLQAVIVDEGLVAVDF